MKKLASPKEVSEKNINIGGIKVVSSKYWYFKAYWLILNYSIFGFLVLIAFTTYDQSSDFPNILFSAFHFEESSNMPKIGKKLKKKPCLTYFGCLIHQGVQKMIPIGKSENDNQMGWS